MTGRHARRSRRLDVREIERRTESGQRTSKFIERVRRQYLDTVAQAKMHGDAAARLNTEGQRLLNVLARLENMR